MTMRMGSDTTRDTLALTQWLSPAFPVGGYAFSHGLHRAVSVGDVAGEVSFADWIGAILMRGSGWNDAVLVSLAHRGAMSDAALDDLAGALAAGAERWRETRDQGAAFVSATGAIGADTMAPMALPVAVGARARALSLPSDLVVALYLQAFAGNLCTIAARIVPLGQSAAQRVLAGQAATIADLAGRAAGAGVEDLASCCLSADLASMAHETQEVRLFRS